MIVTANMIGIFLAIYFMIIWCISDSPITFNFFHRINNTESIEITKLDINNVMQNHLHILRIRERDLKIFCENNHAEVICYSELQQFRKNIVNDLSEIYDYPELIDSNNDFDFDMEDQVIIKANEYEKFINN